MVIDEAGMPRSVEWGFPHLARSRAQIYGVLSTVCGGLPGEELVRLFSSWSISEQVSRGRFPLKIGRGLKQIRSWVVECSRDPSQVAALETEFSRLFRGLGRAKSPPPPYESVYMDNHLLYGASTQRVAETYRRLGVKGWDGEPPDYIAVEMDFMRFLCDREVEAHKSGNAQHLIKEEEAFLREHLAGWVPVFCANVRCFTDNVFYSGLADLTEGWILCDQQIIYGILNGSAV